MIMRDKQLLPLQRIAVDFLATPMPSGTPHKALWSDAGTGKTVVICEALKKVQAKSALILTPAPYIVKRAWATHLVDWGVCSASSIFIVQSGTDHIPNNARFIIINYELIAPDKQVYRDITYWGKYDAVVMDESQYLKDHASKRTQRVLNSHDGLVTLGKWKWEVTATPTPNRHMELWARVRQLAPEIIKPYEKYDDFGERYCGGRECEYTRSTNTPDLRERLKTYAIRHELKQMFPEMPEVIENDVLIDIGDLESGADETNTPQATLRREIGEAKLPYVYEYLDYLLEAKPADKFVVFTWHRSVTESIHARFKEISTTYYGGMSSAAKDAAFDAFCKRASCRLFVVQQAAGGISLDGLQYVCNNVIRVEPNWSDGGYSQNTGRVLRHGQDKPVFDTALIAEKTLDEVIAAVRRRKGQMNDRLHNTKPTKEMDMSIEDKLDTLIELTKANNEMLAAVLNGAVPSPNGKNGAATKAVESTTEEPAATSGKGKAKDKAKDKPAKEAATSTVDDVRAAANAALKRLGKTDANIIKVKGVIESFGAKNADELDEEHYAEAIEQYNSLGNTADVI